MTSSHTISLGQVSTVHDFYEQLSAQLFNGSRQIRNADALADLLQEAQVSHVHVDQWDIPLAQALVIFQVFQDLKITLAI